MRSIWRWCMAILLGLVLLGSLAVPSPASAGDDEFKDYPKDPEAELTPEQWLKLIQKTELRYEPKQEAPKKLTKTPKGQPIPAGQECWSHRTVVDAYHLGWRAWTFGQWLEWCGDGNIITSHWTRVVWEPRSPWYALQNANHNVWEDGGDGWQHVIAYRMGYVTVSYGGATNHHYPWVRSYDYGWGQGHGDSGM